MRCRNPSTPLHEIVATVHTILFFAHAEATIITTPAAALWGLVGIG